MVVPLHRGRRGPPRAGTVVDLLEEVAVRRGGSGLVEEQFEGLLGVEHGQCPAQPVDGGAFTRRDE